MRAAPIALVAAALLSATAAEAADAARGKVTFLSQCSACHTVIANTRDGMGPNLFGVVGRAAGSKQGFAFSNAMKKSGITWDAASLKSFIKDPADAVPGNNMMFMGMSNSTQTDDLVAYLGTLK